jgi:type II secretory pathway pseudopilin PulG
MNLSFQSKVESCGSSAARGGSSFSRRTALTLLEMMVAVTLLAVIMVGLLAMFQYTQRALHVAHMQTDVFENARGAIQLVARDLAEMTAYNSINVINAYGYPVPSPIPGPSTLPLPSGTNQPVIFEEAFWLTRANDDWQGIGYYVDGTNYGVGTLYRFSETVRDYLVPAMIGSFTATPLVKTNIGHRVSDGIVHFQLTAVYPEVANNQTNFVSYSNFEFRSNALPTFIDLELGVLEPATLKQFTALTGNVAVAKNFLRDHVGRIHFFRERVPIRNFINPHRANEVQ